MQPNEESYIHRQLIKNYVCEILVEGKCVSIISVDRAHHTKEEASKIFRKEATTIKEEEDLETVSLRIHQ
jgi:hypothetical protein